MKKSRESRGLSPSILKFSLKMKLCLFFTFAAVFMIHANNYSQNTKVSLDMTNATIEQVFDEIEAQTEFKFMFNTNAVDLNRIVSIKRKSVRIRKILNHLFKNSKTNYEIDNRKILLNKIKVRDIPLSDEMIEKDNIQNFTINGSVVDEFGVPLPGANIVEKGTSNGTQVNFDGNFSLTLSNANATIVVSFLGYTTKEIPVNNQSNIQIQLEVNKSELDEVVIVGYGSLEKRDITGAISSVSSDEFNAGVVTSVADLVIGKVAGLTITQNGSDPTRGASIQLRGPSTLGGSTTPFYVIDGIPGADLSNIAPEDIQSVDVLKDAASTAIYGTRASNGVILVTTKKGAAGASAINFHAYTSIDNVSKTYEMANAAELRNYLSTRSDLAILPEDDDNADTDWNDVITRTGISQNYNLSFSGGSDDSQYYASLTYIDQKGIVKTSNRNRVLGRLRVNHEAFDDRLKLGANISFSSVKQNPVDYSAFFQVNNYLPITNVFEDDGVTYSENLSKIKYLNPLSLLETRFAEDKISNMTANVTAELKLLEGLTANFSGSYEENNRRSGVYISSQNSLDSGRNGQATKSAVRNNSTIVETFLNYKKSFGDHNLDLLTGYSYQEDINNDGVGIANNNFLLDDLGFDGILTGNAPDGFNFLRGTPNKTSSILESVYGRLNYSFKDKYYVTASLRRDGSSVFGLNNKYQTFPGVSLAWRLSQEDFMGNLEFLTDLKIRGGYGETGFQFIDPYQSLARFGQGSLGTRGNAVLVNGVYENTYFFTQNANPDLKWETTSTFNIGLDFELFGGKISGAFEWYTKTTTDMLDTYSVSVPPYAVGTIFANAGEMKNKGFEISLGASVIDNANFKWDTNFVLDRNVNELVSLSNEFFEKEEQFVGTAGGRSLTGVSTSILRPGLPVGAFYTFKWVGYDDTGRHIFEAADGSIVTSDETAYPEDAQVMGDPWPDFQFGWNNSLSYKKFTLNFTLRGRIGGEIFNAAAANLSRIDEADQYNVLSAAIQDGGNRGTPVYSSFWIEDGTFIRMENLTLNYQLPKSDFFNAASVYVTAQNLFTITDFSGVDPDINLSGRSPGVIGAEPNSVATPYFKARSFVLGLRLTL